MSELNEQKQELPIKTGAKFGAIAYIIGLVTTIILSLIDSEIELSELQRRGAEGYAHGPLDFFSHMYSSAHFVDLKVSGAGQEVTRNIIAETPTSLPDVMYYAVPVVILFISGHYLVQKYHANDEKVAAKIGATIVVGYLPMALITRYIFTVEGTFEFQIVTFAPELTMTVMTAVIYPVIFGGLGGYMSFSEE